MNMVTTFEGVITKMKRLLCLIFSVSLLFGISLPVYGADEVTEIPTVNAILDGVPMDVCAELYDGTSYFPLEETVKAFYPECEVSVFEGVFTVKGTGFTLTAKYGNNYFEVNDRYIYVGAPLKERSLDGMVLIPARSLGTALGISVDWDGRVLFTSGGTVLSADDKPYTTEELDLISRVIMHESGNQFLEGKMAVGNVIMNRVNNSSFPSTVYDVIYQKNQFPGATNATPNEESVIAAKLVLEGANVVPDAYWFNGVGKSCWASRNKTLLYTIGGHAFYG